MDKSDKVTSFVIDRLLWLRGSSRSALLIDNGKMCCIGIYAKACEVVNDYIMHVADPSELDHVAQKTLHNAGAGWLFMSDEDSHPNSQDTCQLIDVNDNPGGITAAEREKRITEIFAANGVTVTFIN